MDERLIILADYILFLSGEANWIDGKYSPKNPNITLPEIMKIIRGIKNEQRNFKK